VESKVVAYKLYSDASNIQGITTSKDSKYVFYVSDTNEISQWDLIANKSVNKFKGSHNGQINFLGVSPSNKLMFSAGEDGHFCFYKVPEVSEESEESVTKFYGELPKIENQYWVSLFMHEEEGDKKCVATTLGNEILIIDVINCKVLQKVKVNSNDQTICDCSITLDNTMIVCAGYGTTNLITVETASMTEDKVKVIPSKHSKPPAWGQVTMDGKYILSSNERESIVWEIKTMEPICDEGVRFVGLFAHNRICRGAIQDGLYMKWKP